MPPSPSLAPAVPAARFSPRAVVTAVFFAFAIGIGLWAGSIPALMRQTGLEVAGLGLALTLHTVAYIAAMAGGGQLARIVPPRRLMLASLVANLAGSRCCSRRARRRCCSSRWSRWACAPGCSTWR